MIDSRVRTWLDQVRGTKNDACKVKHETEYVPMAKELNTKVNRVFRRLKTINTGTIRFFDGTNGMVRLPDGRSIEIGSHGLEGRLKEGTKVSFEVEYIGPFSPMWVDNVQLIRSEV